MTQNPPNLRPDLAPKARIDATAREVAGVRNAVGINEVQNFGKFLIKGPKARAWLDRIMAGRIPQPGRMSLTPMLSPKGRLWGDFTVSCLTATEFQLTASYGAQEIHHRWFLQNASADAQVENLGVTLLIDPMSVQYLMGAEIDYKEDIEGAQFVIRNPNAATTCGCGSSFSV